jgi:hypothetical protein
MDMLHINCGQNAISDYDAMYDLPSHCLYLSLFDGDGIKEKISIHVGGKWGGDVV